MVVGDQINPEALLDLVAEMVVVEKDMDSMEGQDFVEAKGECEVVKMVTVVRVAIEEKRTIYVYSDMM